MKTSKFSIAAFVLAGVFFLANLRVSAQQSVSGPEVFHDIYHDVSAPVYTYSDAAPAASIRRIIRPLPQRPVPGVI